MQTKVNSFDTWILTLLDKHLIFTQSTQQFLHTIATKHRRATFKLVTIKIYLATFHIFL